jgi:hypothetical protein
LGPVLPPRGPAINDIHSSNSGKTVVAIVSPTDSIPQGARHQRLEAKVVAAAGPTGNTTQRAHHRCLLQLQWWPLPDPPAAPPRGPSIDVLYNFSGGRCRTCREHPQGPAIDVFYNFGGGHCRTCW